MNGVVLWSDQTQQKAVIWCEDQGDLAYYTQQQQEADISLHEGDLICFDMTLKQNKRVAENPLVLAEAVCTGLAESLSAAKPNSATSEKQNRPTAQIIPFAGATKQKQRDNTSRRCVS